jgi:hypothetical protein
MGSGMFAYPSKKLAHVLAVLSPVTYTISAE